MAAQIPPAVQALIPQSEVAQSALTLAIKDLPLPILNHSIRTFLLAKQLAINESSPFATGPHLNLLFTAAIHHDIGATSTYNHAPRFEVCGADCAKNHLISHSIPEREAHQVWTAIAIHTSPGIAERIDPLARIIRLAVKADFGTDQSRDKIGLREYYNEIEELLPRLDAEKCLGDAVVAQAKVVPTVDKLSWPNEDEKFPTGSWPGILLRARAENPDHKGVNPAF